MKCLLPNEYRDVFRAMADRLRPRHAAAGLWLETRRTAEGPFPMETTYTWESAGSGATRMTLRNRGTPAGFSRLFAPFMAAAMRRANRKDLAALRALLERNK